MKIPLFLHLENNAPFSNLTQKKLPLFTGVKTTPFSHISPWNYQFFTTGNECSFFPIYPKEITTISVLELVGVNFEGLANNSAFNNRLECFYNLPNGVRSTLHVWRWDLVLWVGFQSAWATNLAWKKWWLHWEILIETCQKMSRYWALNHSRFVAKCNAPNWICSLWISFFFYETFGDFLMTITQRILSTMSQWTIHTKTL